MSLSQKLMAATADDRSTTGLAFAAEYRPAGDEKSRIMPPSFPGVKDGDPARHLIIRPKEVEIVTLPDGSSKEKVLADPWVAVDQVQSQANRVEQALNDAILAGRVELPLFQVRMSNENHDMDLTSLELPHRYADAYLRDSTINGVAFDKTEVGLALRKASKRDVSALYRREPYSLIYGAWDSHRKGHQQKFARLYTSEMWGEDWIPADRAAIRVDPLNLSGQAVPDGETWGFELKGVKTKSGKELSKVGHGSVPAKYSLGGGFVSGVKRRGFISSAALARLRFGRDVSAEAAHLGRATLMALALCADRLAFGAPSVWLRSGCDLTRMNERIGFEQPGGDIDPIEADAATALEAFNQLRDRADEAGLVMDRDIIEVEPHKGLRDAINYALTNAAPGESEG